MTDKDSRLSIGHWRPEEDSQNSAGGLGPINGHDHGKPFDGPPARPSSIITNTLRSGTFTTLAPWSYWKLINLCLLGIVRNNPCRVRGMSGGCKGMVWAIAERVARRSIARQGLVAKAYRQRLTSQEGIGSYQWHSKETCIL